MKKFVLAMLALFIAVNFSAIAQKADATGAEAEKQDNKRVIMAKEMLAKTASVIGGLQSYDKIKTMHVKGRRDVVDPSRGMKEDFEFWINLEDSSFYAEYIYGGINVFKSCYNGEFAWAQNPFANNNIALRISRTDQRFIPEIMQFLIPTVYDYNKNGLKVKFEDEYELKNGNDYNKIRATYTDDTQEDFYFDLKTAELYKRQVYTENYLSQKVDQELFYDTWQTVDGIKFPKQSRQVHNGVEQIVYYFDSIELNVEIDKALFVMPESPVKQETSSENE